MLHHLIDSLKFLNTLPMHETTGTYPTYVDNWYAVAIDDRVFANTTIFVKPAMETKSLEKKAAERGPCRKSYKLWARVARNWVFFKTFISLWS
jgi:hypothetical protein